MATRGIDAVLLRMDRRLERAVATNDPQGYFTAVYRAVTARVRDGIRAGEFEDGPRMERFDVTFAELYLDAADAYDRGEPVCRSWRGVFDHWRSRLLVLQHVLLGMNAHINLDLGIAAARTTDGSAIIELERDFETMNDVLADMVDRMQDALGTVSPLTATVDRLGLRSDELLSCWSIEYARDRAWRFAQALAATDDVDRAIDERDRRVAAIGSRIARPSRWARPVLAVARRLESADVASVTQALRDSGAPVPST